MAQMFDSTLSLQEQFQLNYITSKEQLKKPKAVNALCEKEEEQVKEIWVKVVKRADRHILTTLNSIFEKVS
jgi:sugar-specific transcriptional regulator TrmB